MSGAGALDQEIGPTITAALADGPLRGTGIVGQVVLGRPPSTVEVRADDESTCRYCLTEWTQSGPSAKYTFLYPVSRSGSGNAGRRLPTMITV